MKKSSRLIKCCQICESKNLESIIFLGYLPPVNHLYSLGDAVEKEDNFPLELVRCKNCGLVQINLEISKEILFPFEYPYLSGTTKVLIDNFLDLSQEVERLNLLKQGDLIVDIGSNDGSLLKAFDGKGYRLLGIEPSRAAKVAINEGIPTLNEYFTDNIVSNVIEKYGKAKIITATNVFAHITQPTKLLNTINRLLDKDGIFINESHYLSSLIKTLQYDTIYHEHLRYYDLKSLKNLLDYENMKIFHAKKIKTHGGSIRVYATKSKRINIQTSVKSIFDEETKTSHNKVFSKFKDKIIDSKMKLLNMIRLIKQKKQKIYGIGAPSRASTLICYTGIDDGLIDCVLEVTGSYKLNKYMPGTRIPILDEKKLFKDQPEYVLLLSWHISDGLIKILKKKGFRGKFIVPLPKPKIIS